ncbi:hypothetical protein [Leifsonia virtsii]|uniref:Uncharacterized protein n=1 Tax=Leifsonia virtsii TaxID=3035915 RepID=A0ABT8IZK9_9MICO|nr:hypothetical protein [Leifsonia virtsii]MDN4598225.1 hypothetical protein [Leifsonia virtsii]
MVTEDDATPPEPRRGPEQEWWRNALSHPDVEGVDIVEDLVRVRLRSGIELEWSRDDGWCRPHL